MFFWIMNRICSFLYNIPGCFSGYSQFTRLTFSILDFHSILVWVFSFFLPYEWVSSLKYFWSSMFEIHGQKIMISLLKMFVRIWFSHVLCFMISLLCFGYLFSKGAAVEWCLHKWQLNFFRYNSNIVFFFLLQGDNKFSWIINII